MKAQDFNYFSDSSSSSSSSSSRYLTCNHNYLIDFINLDVYILVRPRIRIDDVRKSLRKENQRNISRAAKNRRNTESTRKSRMHQFVTTYSLILICWIKLTKIFLNMSITNLYSFAIAGCGWYLLILYLLIASLISVIVAKRSLIQLFPFWTVWISLNHQLSQSFTMLRTSVRSLFNIQKRFLAIPAAKINPEVLYTGVRQIA